MTSKIPMAISAALTALCLMASSPLAAQDRLPPVPHDRMNEAEREAVAQFKGNRGVEIFGPIVQPSRSPEVMLRAMALGDYLRNRSALPAKVNEPAILVTARQWTQQYEWDVHLPVALSEGLSPDTARAIADGRRPLGLSEDEEIVYEFSMELHRNQSVSDATFNRALRRSVSRAR